MHLTSAREEIDYGSRVVTRRPSVLLGLVLLAAISVPVGASSGCKGGGGSGGSGGTVPCQTSEKCYDTAACYKPGPTRSFANDVVPIFEASCVNDFSCHGNGQQPFLGPQSGMLGPNDVAMIYSNLTTTIASETLAEHFVEAGKPESSFLMHKVDRDLSCKTIGCKPNALGCGVVMPNNGAMLPVEQRDTIRDWINQGAMNN